MSRAWFLVTLACMYLGHGSAAAQQPDAHQRLPDSVRLSLGAGLGVVSGPNSTADGHAVENGKPFVWPPFMPTAVVRVDVPVGPFVLLAVQSTVFYWELEDKEQFGDTGHYTFDVSAVGRVRLGLGKYHRHEVVLSLPFGPSFDRYDLGPRRFGGKLDNEVGWHAGGFASYQFVRARNNWGVFGEVGLIYHHLPKSIEYQSSTEELLYEPYQLFIRGGFIFLPFR